MRNCPAAGEVAGVGAVVVADNRSVLETNAEEDEVGQVGDEVGDAGDLAVCTIVLVTLCKRVLNLLSKQYEIELCRQS